MLRMAGIREVGEGGNAKARGGGREVNEGVLRKGQTCSWLRDL